MLYTVCSSIVGVNGRLSPSVAVKSGVRQGCPLSPILFILVIEPLVCALIQNKLIKGLIPPGSSGNETKFTMYMDDLILLLTDNSSTIKSLMVYKTFTVASGTKVNKDKNEIIYFKWREVKECWGLTEKSETIKILGVEIGKDMEIKNWKLKVAKIQSKLLRWKERELAFMGKVLVLKSEVIASLASLATMLLVPYKVLVSLRKAMFCFLWGSQQEKLKREIMSRPVGMGERGVPEIVSKFKAMFIAPILRACLNSPIEALWPYFVKFWVGHRVLQAWGKQVTLGTPFSEQHPSVYEVVIKTLKCIVTQTTTQVIRRNTISSK